MKVLLNSFHSNGRPLDSHPQTSCVTIVSFCCQFEAWIQEKLQIATDESFRDLTNIQRKLQRHQAFEAEITANKDGFDSINAVSP